MNCTFCQNDGELHEVDSPAIRLCASCREKLGTHIAVICSHCQILYWLPKTPENVARACEMSDFTPEHIMENHVIHELKSCKNCYETVADFTAKVGWVQ